MEKDELKRAAHELWSKASFRSAGKALEILESFLEAAKKARQFEIENNVNFECSAWYPNVNDQMIANLSEGLDRVRDGLYA